MTRFRRFVLCLAFSIIFVSNLLAGIPPFSARTFDGEFISDSSLRGRVVLVQFWTTWCPWCRHDQPIVDDLESRYADKGLIVLAVNVGESEDVVRAYLSRTPRSSHVVLNSAANLASRLGARGYPTYVVIDAQGRVVARRSGSAEEEWLVQMLGRAGLSARSGGTGRMTAASKSPRDSSSPKMISVPSGPATAISSKPRQKAVFILLSGERLESEDYTIDSKTVTVTTEAKKRVIELSQLNKDATKAANRERGLSVPIPENPGEIVLSF